MRGSCSWQECYRIAVGQHGVRSSEVGVKLSALNEVEVGLG